MKFFSRWKTREEVQKEELSQELNDCNLISFLTEAEKETLKKIQHRENRPKQFVVERASKSNLLKASVERKLVSLLRNKLNSKDRDEKRGKMTMICIPADLKAKFKQLAGERNMSKVVVELITTYVEVQGKRPI